MSGADFSAAREALSLIFCNGSRADSTTSVLERWKGLVIGSVHRAARFSVTGLVRFFGGRNVPDRLQGTRAGFLKTSLASISGSYLEKTECSPNYVTAIIT
jgi:hypothetical protein